MRIPSLSSLAVLLLTTGISAQSNQTPSESRTVTPVTASKDMVLVGCVAADNASPEQFTLTDTKEGLTYRLNGSKLRTYTGHRVRIVGGLYPSASIAAQAGAIDPTKAAIAATAPNAADSANVEFPKFQVAQVRQLKGSCAPAAPK